ncbi:Yip1 domain protein [Roseovarius albus]|uniref:Yip1 domain protein n=1 Tax=Roseovarius albus TaxID=1247867 RepID=A0A1X6YXQ4_9RHOB|nr:YIP1 family protein [Roseovarius albus]SLN34808.1 Yip1 domain protein [Roseovarius albus]
MSATRDIVATYRSPRRVMQRLLQAGQREDRALVFLISACMIVFVAQWPRLTREAHLTEQELNPLLGGALLGWIFIAPLFFYALALVSHWVLRLIGGKNSAYAARIALFWAFLAASPLILLHGLVAGFIGPGPGLSLVGFVWFILFLWFWIANMREAGWGDRK